MCVADIRQARVGLFAYVNRNRTARMEAATRGKVDGIRCFALKDDVFLA